MQLLDGGEGWTLPAREGGGEGRRRFVWEEFEWKERGRLTDKFLERFWSFWKRLRERGSFWTRGREGRKRRKNNRGRRVGEVFERGEGGNSRRSEDFRWGGQERQARGRRLFRKWGTREGFKAGFLGDEREFGKEEKRLGWFYYKIK